MQLLKIIPVLLILCSCTSVKVSQLDASHDLKHVCIQDNPKVMVGEFLGVVEDGFQDHAITTEIYSGDKPAHCAHHLTYTALRTWDFSPYLSHAELRLFEGNKRIAYAEYHLRGKGGFSPTKWASVRSKMTPVIEELLAEYR